MNVNSRENCVGNVSASIVTAKFGIANSILAPFSMKEVIMVHHNSQVFTAVPRLLLNLSPILTGVEFIGEHCDDKRP